MLLWVAQVVLAALFLFAGGMKLVTPIAEMQQGGMALPGALLRFIGGVTLLWGGVIGGLIGMMIIAR